jgi:hypothetical protein
MIDTLCVQMRHVKVETQISEIKFQDPEILYLIM